MSRETFEFDTGYDKTGPEQLVVLSASLHISQSSYVCRTAGSATSSLSRNTSAAPRHSTDSVACHLTHWQHSQVHKKGSLWSLSCGLACTSRIISSLRAKNSRNQFRLPSARGGLQQVGAERYGTELILWVRTRSSGECRLFDTRLTNDTSTALVYMNNAPDNVFTSTQPPRLATGQSASIYVCLIRPYALA